MTALDGWANFYVIVGSSAGALIGLQFVVMTLLADVPVAGADEQAGNAFGTPNVVHFGVVLLLSALLSAPWQGVGAPAVLWGLAGLGGVVYAGIVARRMRRQTIYRPVFEDWLFHLLLPFVAYVVLAAAAVVAIWRPRAALFLVAASSLLLLFIGIHNAWDTVTWLILRAREEREATPDGGPRPPA